MADETLGASFSIDVSNLKAGLTQANRLIRESNSEFKAVAAGLDDWSSSQEGLEAKQKQLNKTLSVQQTVLAAYEQQLLDAGYAEDDMSAAAVELRTKINNQRAAVAATEKAIAQNADALENLGDASDDAGDEIKDMGKEAEDAGGKLDGLKTVAGGVVKGIAAIGAACVGAVTAFLGLAESTRETRTAMAKLETSFTTAGMNADDAKETFTTLYGVLGDTDKATEASAHLAQLANNEEELAEWTDICTGIYGTFGESIPIESLTEAANETAKNGQLTGALSDALVWAGKSEDAFQESLDACNTESEREALIRSTLNGLYSEASEAYKENNKDVIAAQEAQADLNLAVSELGAIAEPIMTTLKNLATDLIVSITPFVSLIGDGLQGALEGTAGATTKLSYGLGKLLETVIEKITAVFPTVLSAIAGVIPAVLTALTSALPTIVGAVVDVVPQITDALLGALPLLVTCVFDIISALYNSAGDMLPQIVMQVVDVVPQIINSLIAAIPELLQAAITFLLSIVNAIPTIIQALLEALPTIIDTIINGLLEALPQLIEGAITLLMALVDAIPVICEALIVALPTIIDAIVNGLITALPQILQGAITLLMAIIQAIPTIVSALATNIPMIISTIQNTLLNNIPAILAAAVQLFLGIIKAIPQIVVSIISSMPQIISAIVSGIQAGFTQVVSVGENLIRGLWQGISNMTSWIGEKIKGFGESVVTGLKNFFGIKSPSKLMANVIGKNLALGIGQGFENSIGDVNKEIQSSMNFEDAKVSVNANASGVAGGIGSGVVVYQTNNYSQAHSRYELWKSKQQTAAAVRLALQGV